MSIVFLDPSEGERIRGAVNRDPEFKLASRYMTRDFLLVVGSLQCIVRVREGVITEIKLDPTPYDSWSFFIRGPAESWENFLKTVPPPFYNGVYAGMIRGKFEVGGDLEAAFAHYWAVTRMFDVMREMQNRKNETKQ